MLVKPQIKDASMFDRVYIEVIEKILNVLMFRNTWNNKKAF